MFDMLEAKVSDTTMATTTKIEKDDYGSIVGDMKYRELIRSLLYLTASMPDIMFNIRLCVRF